MLRNALLDQNKVLLCAHFTILWCCCGWSGLGSATSYVQRMRSTDYLNVLNDHIILSLDFVCSESTGMFKDENPGFFMLKL